MTVSSKGARPWEAAFLRAVSAGSTQLEAARKANIHVSTTQLRRKRNDAFAKRLEKALSARSAAGAAGDAATSGSGRRGPKWKKGFLDMLSQTSNVTASAASTNTPLRTIYNERRKDPHFAQQWRSALHEGYEHLEMEVLAYLRGHGGAQKIDVASAIRLLAAHRQTIAEIRAVDADDEAEVIASINDLIDRMRREDAERRAAEDSAHAG